MTLSSTHISLTKESYMIITNFKQGQKDEFTMFCEAQREGMWTVIMITIGPRSGPVDKWATQSKKEY